MALNTHHSPQSGEKKTGADKGPTGTLGTVAHILSTLRMGSLRGMRGEAHFFSNGRKKILGGWAVLDTGHRGTYKG